MEILEKHGITRQKPFNSQTLKARQCEHCHTVNGPTHSFCGTCGRPARTLKFNSHVGYHAENGTRTFITFGVVLSYYSEKETIKMAQGQNERDSYH
jgi:hypothetical protein